MRAFIIKLLSIFLFIAFYQQSGAYQTKHPVMDQLPLKIKEMEVAADNLVVEEKIEAAKIAYTKIIKTCKKQGLMTQAIHFYSVLFMLHASYGNTDLGSRLDSINHLYQKENNSDLWGTYCGGLALAYAYSGVEDSLQKYCNIACLHHQQKGFHELEMDLYLGICIEYYLVENTPLTLFYLQKAEKLYEEKFIPANQPCLNLYDVQSVIYTEALDYEKAIKANRLSLELKKQDSTTHPSDLVSAYNSIALLYDFLHDYKDAILYYKRALKIAEKPQNFIPQETAYLLTNLSYTYNRKKEYEKSILFSKRALLCLQQLTPDETKAPDIQEDLIRTYAITGKSYALLNQLDSALHFLDKGEQLSGENNNLKLSEIYFYYSITYENNGHYDKAFNYALKALQLGLQEQEANYLFEIYKQLASINLQQKEFSKALFSTQQALATISTEFTDKTGWDNPTKEQITPLPGLWQVLELKTQTLTTLKNQNQLDVPWEVIYETAKLTTEVYEENSKKIRQKNSKRNWLDRSAIPLFEQAIQIALRLHRSTGDAKYLNEAFQLSERSKSMLMNEVFQTKQAAARSGIPESLLLREDSLKNALGYAKKKQLDAQMRRDTPSILIQDSVVFEYTHQLDLLEYEFETNYPTYYQEKYATSSIHLQDIQAILDDSTCFIEYFEGKDSLYMFTLTKETADVLVKGKNIRYEARIQKLKENIIDFESEEDVEKRLEEFNEFVPLASQLYEEFLAPCITPDAKRLILVPDGALDYIPFEALLTKKTPFHDQSNQLVDYSALPYLIKDYIVSYSYSGKLLQTLSQKRNNFKASRQLLVAAPSYDVTTSEAQRNPYEQALRQHLEKLPGAQGEAKELHQKFHSKLLGAKKANEVNLKAEAPNYGILHLAMHGVVDTENPDLSGLVLEENDDPKEDNILYAYEIQEMDLEAQLVVLSACETAMGTYQSGEGVLSLGRSFMYAGTPSLLTTLWSLNDGFSPQIMRLFYANLEKGMDKDMAIRQAKLACIRDGSGIVSHPALWACLIQVGDHHAIQLKTRTDYWQYALGIFGIGLGLLGLYYGFRKRKESAA